MHAPWVFPDAQHVTEYHIVTEGHCWGGAVNSLARHFDRASKDCPWALMLDQAHEKLDAGDCQAGPAGVR